MNSENTVTGHLLLFRGPGWDHGLTSAEIQKTLDALNAWLDGVQRQHKVLAGEPLASAGRIISATKSAVVSDGPFAESKEGIGGYLLLATTSLEEATAVARACPTLHLGISIEVRPVVAECPCTRRARLRTELQTA
jgi:hypothetical protein